MYRVINCQGKTAFQAEMDKYSEQGYTLLIWEGFYSGTWSCVMTLNTDHPKVEVKNV